MYTSDSKENYSNVKWEQRKNIENFVFFEYWNIIVVYNTFI